MLRYFVSFARPYMPLYALSFGLLIVTNGLMIWIPWLLRDAVNALQRGDSTGEVARLALMMVGVAILQGLARVSSRLAALGNSRKIVRDVRTRFFEHLQRLGASYYDRNRTGDIMSRGMNDIQMLQGFYGPGIMNMFNTIIVYSAVLTLLFRIDSQLTLVSVVFYPLLSFAVNRLSRRVYSRSLAVQEQLGLISTRAQENISGVQQVKVFAQEEREISGFRELCREYRERNLALVGLRGMMTAVIGLGTGVATLVVLFVGGQHVIEGRIGLGDFVAFNAYLGLLVWPTIALGWVINTFQRGAGAMNRLQDVFQETPDMPSTLDEDEDEDGVTMSGRIEIKGLTFSYETTNKNDHRVPTLRDINLTIEPGSRVGLVGPVGSGKSTLVNLLARVYPVPQGTIFLDGVDITTLPVASLRKNIGFVPQEAFLFSRTLRENIAFGQPESSDAQILKALQISNLERDLETMPDGMETMVGERGVMLSGGQRQRATLARAVIGNRSILILDDSLSSVDADTERTILARLDNLLKDRTSILISHRLSSLAVVDRIIVMDRGRIAEQGSHDELLASKGLYARLFHRHELECRLEDS